MKLENLASLSQRQHVTNHKSTILEKYAAYFFVKHEVMPNTFNLSRKKMKLEMAILFVAGMLLTNIALGDVPRLCQKKMAGNKSCIAGEMMLCNKEFDPKKNDFIYEWHAINESGQTFDIFSPYYKQVAGYTPAKCNEVGNK